MKNPRITKKDFALIKGALRRVFARSELHRRVIDKTLAPGHIDTSRPRVKKWCKCPACGEFTPRSYMVVDHIDPVIKLISSLEEMSLQELADRIWCEEDNLQAICKSCHDIKTKAENAQRRKNKKESK